ncbi:MAG TPA: M13 family metallopeptidase [Opitutaceae bacterium]|jgi:predicted metalloendopeptidase|nr:M13 family metallopeptidase [Opitutaceae bacterium]
MLKWALLGAAALAVAVSGLAADDAGSGLTANIDPSVSPAVDFFHYADGLWLKTAKIPGDQSWWGTVPILREAEADKLRIVCERASASTGSGQTVDQIVGDLYASGMDADQIAQSGLAPLQFEFDRIDALETPQQVWSEIGHLQSIGVPVGFDFASEIDPRDSGRVIASLAQGGMGLPSRRYYLDADGASLRQKYAGHVARMLGLAGASSDHAAQQAAAVARIETALAQGSLTEAELRDPDRTYHPLSRAQLQALAPNLDWDGLLAALDLPDVSRIDVREPGFVRALGRQIAEAPVADWQAYLRWHVLHAFARALPDPYVAENFAFYGQALTGARRLAPRWHRIALDVDALVGDAVGQLYVAAYFPPEARARVQTLAAQVRAAFRDRLAHVEWMDEPTRARALAKLDAMRVKIGYPDHWRDYSGLMIDRGAYAANVLKAMAFNARYDRGKIGRPPNPDEWSMTPETVNAYYSRNRNEIVFPAGYLQPPLFDPRADPAVNYGGIGAVMGHEMTHGFDDQGRKFNARGELEDWWSAQSAAQFQARAEVIYRQFDAYEVAGVHLNGRLTAGENIADLGGLKLAYAAMETALAGREKTPPGALTPEQKFFLSYARARMAKYRMAELLLLVKTNPHPPAQFRVNGPLSNLDAFAAAFAVPEGSPMRRPPADQVSLW